MGTVGRFHFSSRLVTGALLERQKREREREVLESRLTPDHFPFLLFF